MLTLIQGVLIRVFIGSCVMLIVVSVLCLVLMLGARVNHACPKVDAWLKLRWGVDLKHMVTLIFFLPFLLFLLYNLGNDILIDTGVCANRAFC